MRRLLRRDLRVDGVEVDALRAAPEPGDDVQERGGAVEHAKEMIESVLDTPMAYKRIAEPRVQHPAKEQRRERALRS
jgi:hypothetical protein